MNTNRYIRSPLLVKKDMWNIIQISSVQLDASAQMGSCFLIIYAATYCSSLQANSYRLEFAPVLGNYELFWIIFCFHNLFYFHLSSTINSKGLSLYYLHKTHWKISSVISRSMEICCSHHTLFSLCLASSKTLIQNKFTVLPNTLFCARSICWKLQVIVHTKMCWYFYSFSQNVHLHSQKKKIHISKSTY